MNWSEYFTINAATGELTWTVRPREHFANDRGWNVFNARYAGKVAGKICRDGDGYSCVELVVSTHGKRRSFKAHRVIWEMINGPIPKGIEIDHVDTNSMNNAPSNLRLATRSGNAQNVSRRKDNTSGYKGVHMLHNGRYAARIQTQKTRHPLGVYSTPEEAHEAYKAAAITHHKQYART